MLEIEDRLAAYCLDGAVVTFGAIIENALQERVEIGAGKHKERKPKYTLTQLLKDGFTLPRPESERAKKTQAGMGLRGLVGQGVKVWREKPS